MGKVIKISDELYKKLQSMKGQSSFSEFIAFLLGQYLSQKETIDSVRAEIIMLKRKVDRLVSSQYTSSL